MVSHQFAIDVAGSPMPAYLARPDGDTPRPAVIVLQEIFGVNTEVRRITDLVAGAGYVGLAINYYHRTHPHLNEPYTQEGLERGFVAAQATTPDGLRDDVRAAAAWLGDQPFVAPGRIATWGFCFGGTVAFVTSTLEEISAAVCFYGGSIAQSLDEAPKVHAPLLLVYGADDAYIPAEDIEKTRAALTAAGKTFEIEVYGGQDHAFFRDGGRLAHGANADTPRAVSDAWARVQEFLERNLT